MDEVKAKRYAGPFDKIPFKNYIQSPIRLVQKSNGKLRLIFHLSFDFGDEQHEQSLNYHTPEEMCSVKYKDLDYAIDVCLRLLQAAENYTGTIFFCKADLISAFRILPLKIQQICWLMMKARDPCTKI